MGLGNILKTVGKVVGTASTVARTAIETYKIVRSETSKKAEPMPWGRKHSWQEFGSAPEVKHLEVPYCMACKADKTEANADEMCPGPPGWR